MTRSEAVVLVNRGGPPPLSDKATDAEIAAHKLATEEYEDAVDTIDSTGDGESDGSFNWLGAGVGIAAALSNFKKDGRTSKDIFEHRWLGEAREEMERNRAMALNENPRAVQLAQKQAMTGAMQGAQQQGAAAAAGSRGGSIGAGSALARGIAASSGAMAASAPIASEIGQGYQNYQGNISDRNRRLQIGSKDVGELVEQVNVHREYANEGFGNKLLLALEGFNAGMGWGTNARDGLWKRNTATVGGKSKDGETRKTVKTPGTGTGSGTG